GRSSYVGGWHCEHCTARFDPFAVALDIVSEKHDRGLVLLKHCLLIRFCSWVAVERQLQLSAVQVLWRSHRQPAIGAVAEIRLFCKAQHVCIETQGLFLVVYIHASQLNLHFVSPLLCPLFGARRFPFIFTFVGVDCSMRSRWRSRASMCADQNRRNWASQSSSS